MLSTSSFTWDFCHNFFAASEVVSLLHLPWLQKPQVCDSESLPCLYLLDFLCLGWRLETSTFLLLHLKIFLGSSGRGGSGVPHTARTGCNFAKVWLFCSPGQRWLWVFNDGHWGALVLGWLMAAGVYMEAGPATASQT